jgi:hypothetical protein
MSPARWLDFAFLGSWSAQGGNEKKHHQHTGEVPPSKNPGWCRAAMNERFKLIEISDQRVSRL